MDSKVLIRCDGSPDIGLGHVVRCLALADELSHHHGCSISFAIWEGPLGVDLLKNSAYAVYTPKQEQFASVDEAKWLKDLAIHTQASCLILDIRTNLSCQALKDLRNSGILLVTIDDPSDRRLICDLAFYPPVPQVRQMNWDGFKGEYYSGWEWVPLRHQFSMHNDFCNEKRNMVNLTSPLNILISMGGSDKAGLTFMAIRTLESILGDLNIIVVLGSGFMYDLDLQNLLSKSIHSYELHRNVIDIASLMARADLAITSFGVTAYELAAMSVPSLHICLSSDHACSATEFEKAGVATSLGIYTEVEISNIKETLVMLINSPLLLKSMRDKALELPVKEGCRRVARKILEKI
jgi:spore coat polysaccharide biosynthesis predicted glycosyltransferase SpsG